MNSKLSSNHFVKKYLTWIFLGFCLIVLAIFWGVNYKVNSLIKKQLLRQSRAFFQEIVLTRNWMADHGGVYVKLRPGMEANPFLLAIPDLPVVLNDQNGDKYILKNPALATREISELAESKGLFKFHITSLKPLNPNNAPDAFEREALFCFEQGTKEYFRFAKSEQEMVFHYMAPLMTEKPCLECHGAQGYKEGDVRGGIRVSIPATAIVQQMKESRIGLLLSAFGIILIVSAVIFFISKAFKKDLDRANARLVEMASKDFLTGLLNRREAYRLIASEVARADRFGAPMGIILLDLDHFKRVNDTYGHATGDLVLKTAANALSRELRGYDIVCRFGGEEFLVVLQETKIERTVAMADRLRAAIEKQKIPLSKGEFLSVTVSIGVTERMPNENIDTAIDRADKALYRAKQAGRNRVVAEPGLFSLATPQKPEV